MSWADSHLQAHGLGCSQGRLCPLQPSRGPGDEHHVVAIPLDSPNTADYWEGDPRVSQDGTHILFASDRNGFVRIYEAWR